MKNNIIRITLMAAAVAVVGVGCSSHPVAQLPVAPSTTAPSTLSAPRTMHGATVTLSANYPTVDDVFTNAVTGTVPVGWPKGTLYGTRNLVQVSASFDVTDTTVTETFLMTAGLGVWGRSMVRCTSSPARRRSPTSRSTRTVIPARPR